MLDDGVNSPNQAARSSLVAGASRARPLGELRHPRHDQRPRPLAQRGVVVVSVLSLRLQPPGRLDGSKNGGRVDSHGEQQEGEESSRLGRHGWRDRG